MIINVISLILILLGSSGNVDDHFGTLWYDYKAHWLW